MTKRYVWSRERGLRVLKEGVMFAEYVAKYPSARLVGKPGHKAMFNMLNLGVAKAVDGCRVEPDGACPHGYPSWLKVIGIC